MSMMKEFLLDRAELFSKYHPDYDVTEATKFIMDHYTLEYWTNYRDYLKTARYYFYTIHVTTDEDTPLWSYPTILTLCHNQLAKYYEASQILIEKENDRSFTLYFDPTLPKKACGMLGKIYRNFRLNQICDSDYFLI